MRKKSLVFSILLLCAWQPGKSRTASTVIAVHTRGLEGTLLTIFAAAVAAVKE